MTAAALTSLLVAVPAAAQTVSLGSAETFAVLGSTSVANTGATTLNGDLGVFPGTTLPPSPPLVLHDDASRHAGDAVAAQAAEDVDEAFSDLGALTCPAANTLEAVYPGGTLTTPGVYCFNADNVQINGNLTLTGPGQYIFKVAGTLQVTGNVTYALTPPPPADPQACNGSNVFWRVAGTTAALNGAAFVGSLLAHEDATLASGVVVDGRVLSHEGDVTLNANTVTACTAGKVFGTHTDIKVTGGGSIPVQGAGSNGFANYGFNAAPGATEAQAAGSFNYLNHSLGSPPYHLHGTVTDVDVVSVDDEGLAQTVRLSGVCRDLANCTFSAVVEDNGEPGRDDQFGVIVVLDGEVVEEQEMRVVRNGNIQFHTGTLETEVDDTTVRGGETMRLSARLHRDKTVSSPVDAYVVLRMPNGQMLSWTGSALVPGLVPVARNFVPFDFAGTLLQLQVPLGTPAGTYSWMSALTDAGTLNMRSGIFERIFTIEP